MSDLMFRQATDDAGIWHSVAGANEYGLPERFEPRSLVIDIGAHIGAFSYAVLDRGASWVLAVEADHENAQVWQHNLHAACRATDRAVLLTAACWRSDARGETHVSLNRTGKNTGGSHVLAADGHPVATVGLDSVIDLGLSISRQKTVRLLKLDCEGAEWPILFTSKRLPAVAEIVGEYHLGTDHRMWIKPADISSLAAHLNQLGFCFESRQTDERGLGIFRAVR